MIAERPISRSWAEQGEMFDALATGLFSYLQTILTNGVQLNFTEIYNRLETWKPFAEKCGQYEINRWHIMQSLVWCAEQAHGKAIIKQGDVLDAPEFIKQGWAQNCISILRNEPVPIISSIDIPVAISDSLTGKAYIHTLLLEVLNHGNGDLYHHPIDALVTFPSKDFEESMQDAWISARNLFEEQDIDIRHDGRWRLLDRDGRPILNIKGKSASGAAARGWWYALQKRLPSRKAIVLAQIDKEGILTDVMGIKEKTTAIVADDSLNTIIVVSDNSKQCIQAILGKSNNANTKTVNVLSGATTLKKLVEEVETVISARVDSYYPNELTRVKIGKPIKLSVTITNTGNTSWRFIPGARIWNSNGSTIAVPEKVLDFELQPGQQTTVDMPITLHIAGDYWIQYGVWKNKPYHIKANLLHKIPRPSKHLITVYSD